MSSKLAAIISIAFFVAGCSVESAMEYKHAHYENNSGVAVKVTVIAKDTIDTPSYYHISHTAYEMELEDGGESFPRFINSDYGCAYIAPTYSCKMPMYFKIEFFSEPKACLVFDGDNKIDDYDIRYWENYTLVSTDVEKTSDENTNYYRNYYYYITPELMKLAKEESCDP